MTGAVFACNSHVVTTTTWPSTATLARRGRPPPRSCGGAGDCGSRPCPARPAANRPAHGRPPADTPADRPDGRYRTQRTPGRLESAWVVVPAHPAAAGVGGAPDARRAQRDGATDERSGNVPGRCGGLARSRDIARMAASQRQLPSCSAPPGRCRRATSRTPAWVPWVRRGGAQPQCHPDAGVPHDARRGRDRRAQRPAASVGVEPAVVGDTGDCGWKGHI